MKMHTSHLIFLNLSAEGIQILLNNQLSILNRKPEAKKNA